MSILVTGGAGFIGSTLIETLVAQGTTDIIAIDNFNDYYNPEFKEKNAAELSISVQRVDIRDMDALKTLFESNAISSVVHLASMVGVRPSIADPFIYEEVNIKGTLNLLECCKQFKVKKFVFGSSSSVYGSNMKIPFSETDNTDSPMSPYGASKKSAELLCKSYTDLYGISCVCLRFFTVYGPKGRPDMAPYLFTEKIFKGQPITMFGDGSTERDYTFVADIVAGIIASINLNCEFEVFNLGNNKPVKLTEFISIIEKHLDKKAVIEHAPMQPGDMPKTYADIDHAQEKLGYLPKTSIEDGLKQFCEWYVANRA